MSRPLFMAVAVLAGFCALPALAKPACHSPAEGRALQVRQLHIQLQVASLNCRGDDPSLPGKYASYVHRFGGALTENAKVLRGHFGGDRPLDRHVTNLANQESDRAHNTENYCESHTPLFEKLLGLKPQELEHFASQNVEQPEGATCGKDVSQAKADKPKQAKKPVEKKS